MTDPWELAQCDTLGQVFMLSAHLGYSSENFIKVFMNSAIASKIDKEFHHLHWAGKQYIMSSLEDEYGDKLTKIGPIFDLETLYWTGHIYRYWHFLMNETSKSIYKMAPAKTMQTVYLMYHTMSSKMAIERLIDSYTKKNK